jgi:hypothetical protein
MEKKMNKKAIMDELIKNILWIVLFLILLVALGVLFKKMLT